MVDNEVNHTNLGRPRQHRSLLPFSTTWHACLCAQERAGIFIPALGNRYFGGSFLLLHFFFIFDFFVFFFFCYLFDLLLLNLLIDFFHLFFFRFFIFLREHCLDDSISPLGVFGHPDRSLLFLLFNLRPQRLISGFFLALLFLFFPLLL